MADKKTTTQLSNAELAEDQLSEVNGGDDDGYIVVDHPLTSTSTWEELIDYVHTDSGRIKRIDKYFYWNPEKIWPIKTTSYVCTKCGATWSSQSSTDWIRYFC